MASRTRSAVVCALVFLLSVVADARVFPDIQDFFPEIETTTTNIPLPREKPTTELDSHAALKKPLEKKKEAPMTTVKFRPINRHFSIRPTDRPRHGDNVNRLRPWTPRYGRIRDIPYGNDVISHPDDQHSSIPAGTPHREIPYGNDVIFPAADQHSSISSGTPLQKIPYGNDVIFPADKKDSTFATGTLQSDASDGVLTTDQDSTSFASGTLDVPLRWTEIGYERPRVNLKDDILPSEVETPHLRHRHHHRLGRFEKKFGVERQSQENAIVNKIRKFLNHF